MKEYLFDLLQEKTQDNNYTYSICRKTTGYNINITKYYGLKSTYNMLVYIDFKTKKKDAYDLINEMFLRLDDYKFKE